MNYLKEISTRKTPQSEALPGQIPNSAGGHAWAVDDWARLHRFLILGSEGGSYYVGQRELTVENAHAVMHCIELDGARAVTEIATISKEGRAPQNDPAIFALALAASAEDKVTRRLALNNLSTVCRIGTHLFTFAEYVQNFRGWGRGLRQAIGEWYQREDLAYQLIKYRQRGGWTHRDLLRLAHPLPENVEQERVLGWATGKYRESLSPELPNLITAYEKAQAAETPKDTAQAIRDCPDLPREALNPDHLNSPEVWEALLGARMPMTALIRNLATMTRAGVIAPMSEGTKTVCEQLADEDWIRKSRVHPLAVLVAMSTYAQGHGYRSGNEWDPVAQVVDALDQAFYVAFGNVESSGQRTLLGLDVSGSMATREIAGLGITPRVGSAAMALVTAAVEPEHYIMGFGGGFVSLPISPRQRLTDVVREISNLPFDRTDCAVPMLWALENVVEVDTFVVYTDNETWYGNMHPSQALEQYRQKSGINAKLVVVSMLANAFSIADPSDAGMLDVVGFDTATPNVISAFARD